MLMNNQNIINQNDNNLELYSWIINNQLENSNLESYSWIIIIIIINSYLESCT